MAPSVRGPDFWRRRFAAFRGPGRLDQDNPKPSTQFGANKPAASRAVVPAPDRPPEDNEPESVAGQDVIPSTPRQSQGSGRSKGRRNQQILVKDDQPERGRQLTASDVHSFDDLAALLKADLLHVSLMIREAAWSRILNRHLYPQSKASRVLLFGALALFLVGSFWSGIATLTAAYFWEGRSDE